MGKGEKETLPTVGGGVDGELLPVLLLLSPVRGRGYEDAIGLLELDESLDAGQPAEAKRRCGILRSKESENDNTAESSALSW